MTLLQENGNEIMKVRKGKEPREGIVNAMNKKLTYKLSKGCQFEYDKSGWK